MDSNNNEKAPPRARHKLKSTKRRIQGWNNIKSDVDRMYIREKWHLEDTMAAIQARHGFKASLRAWKSKLKEWGYTKYLKNHGMRCIVAKGAKRALEGEGDSQEDTYEESTQYCGPLSKTSSISMAQANSIWSLRSDSKSPLTTRSDSTAVLPITKLDRYLSDELQPWSEYNLSHQLEDNDIALAKLRQQLALVTGLVADSEEQSSSPTDPPDEQRRLTELFCIGDQFFVDYWPVTDDEQENEASGTSDLEELFSLAATLAAYQNEHGEFARPTLKQELELAKADERNGNLEEAEYHCRRILGEDLQVNVQAYLGMILANTSRHEEATSWLFSALTGFIIAFGFSSAEANAQRFPSIEALFIELNHKTEQDWSSLVSCLCEMMDRIQTAISEENLGQIFPQLLIYGFSLANECSALGILNSAKYMYQVLLECSSHLDMILYGFEMATAHQKYGHLLRREGKWASSAEQLLLACKSVLHSGIHDNQLIELLETDHTDLLPYLTAESTEAVSLTEAIAKISTRKQRQSPPPMRAAHFLRTDGYSSSDLPLRLEPSAGSYAPQLGSLAIAISPADEDEHCNSIASVSMETTVSNRFGVTGPSSEGTGIDNSAYMVDWHR